MLSGIDLILHYFPNLTEKQQQQFIRAAELYKDWNEKINLVSRNDIAFLYERHFLHSLGIAKVIAFKKNTSVLDAGTGGGFPGIPLAILFPECNFLLADSIGKKIKVVKDIIQQLGLSNVSAEQIRVEDIPRQFDFIVSRAVTEFPVFYNWVKDTIKKESFNDLPNGILYLKGGGLEEELNPFKNRVKIFELKYFFKEAFFETKKLVYWA